MLELLSVHMCWINLLPFTSQHKGDLSYNFQTLNIQ